jgi:hypothetical protein
MEEIIYANLVSYSSPDRSILVLKRKQLDDHQTTQDIN